MIYILLVLVSIACFVVGFIYLCMGINALFFGRVDPYSRRGGNNQAIDFSDPKTLQVLIPGVGLMLLSVLTLFAALLARLVISVSM